MPSVSSNVCLQAGHSTRLHPTALEKDRDLRYQSASDLRADLRRLQRSAVAVILQPAANTATAPAPLELLPTQNRRFWPFRPAWLIAGLVTLVVVASALATTEILARRKSANVASVAAVPSETTAATNSPVLSTATAPSAVPRTITLKETKEQVVAAFGFPKKVVKLGTKEIDYYPDMKVTFINDRVTDVE